MHIDNAYGNNEMLRRVCHTFGISSEVVEEFEKSDYEKVKSFAEDNKITIIRNFDGSADMAGLFVDADNPYRICTICACDEGPYWYLALEVIRQMVAEQLKNDGYEVTYHDRL